MNLFLSSWAGSLLSLLALDGVWLSLMLKRFYDPRLAHLTGTPHYGPAILFYVLYTFALTLLILLPALREHSSLSTILWRAGLFGLTAYATYDLTNQATLNAWPLSVTLVDLLWGTVVTATVALLVTSVLRHLFHL